MTRGEFDLFLTYAMALCGLLVFVSILRAQVRGVSGYFQAGAFVCMAGLLFSLKAQWPQSVTTVAAVLVATCFALDVLNRKPPEQAS